MTSTYLSRLCLGASAIALLGAHGALAQAAPPPAAPLPEAAAAPDTSAVEAVVVTGSRLQAGFQAPTPVTVLGAAQMQEQAPTTVYDIVKDIPSFRPSAGPTVTSYGVASANQVLLDLRGLGSTRTLNLVDGHRPTPVQSTGVFDTNMIPTSLIDRTEVVTGGASAAYGSDAVAGVVNFIIKDRLEGLTGSVQYQITQQGDGVEQGGSLAWGTAFAGGKGHFVVGGEYNEAHGIGSMYKRAWGRLEPGIVTLPTNRAAGLPANIIANNVEIASFTRGGIINSGPLKGTAFDTSGNPYAFQYGPLVGSLTMYGSTANYTLTQYSSTPIRSPYDRASAMAKAEYDLTPDIQAYASVDWGILNAHSNTGRNPNPASFVISRDNAYLPPATLQAMIANNLQTVIVGRQDVEYPASQSANRDYTLVGVAGLKGTVFNNWKWDLALDSGRSQFDARLLYDAKAADLYASVYAVKNAQGQIVCGPVATNPYFNAQNATAKATLLSQVEPGCVPFNIFGQGRASQDSVNYFLSTGTQENYIRQDDVAFNLTGSPITLPAGPVSLAVGAEWRKNSVNATSCAICQGGGLVIFNFGTYSGQLSVKEGYGELGIPVLKDMPLFKSLDLNGAIRRTDYSLSGAVTTWKLGGTWDVSDFLRLRATRSRDIRAPNIDELFNPGTDGNGPVVNRANGISGFAHSRTVGNPNLKPEIADTFTAGIALQPTWSWASGFRASVDYYSIIMKSVISSISSQDILDRYYLQHDQSYAQFIAFNSSPLGFNGVYSTRINSAALKTQGLDIEIDYRVPLDVIHAPGAFNIRALGTRVYHLRNITPANTTDSAGYESGLPNWSWNVNFNYSLGRFSGNLLAHYTSAEKYSVSLVGPDDPTYNPANNNSINRNLWPSTLLWTLSLNYTLLQQGDHRLQAFLVTTNLLDKQPPIIAWTETGGGNPYDMVGRAFKFGFRFAY